MKKILFSLVALLCVASVSAQSKFESSVKSAAKAVASQKWSVGLRAGSTVQAVAECFYGDRTYVEGRFGMTALFGSANAPVAADFTFLHNWNCFNMDWTPSAGKWFFDAGVGLSVGGGAHTAYVGVAGNAKFGIKFNKVPIRLAVDFSPAFGYHHTYADKFEAKDEEGKVVLETKPAHGAFWKTGMLNGGISATYCF